MRAWCYEFLMSQTLSLINYIDLTGNLFKGNAGHWYEIINEGYSTLDRALNEG